MSVSHVTGYFTKYFCLLYYIYVLCTFVYYIYILVYIYILAVPYPELEDSAKA